MPNGAAYESCRTLECEGLARTPIMGVIVDLKGSYCNPAFPKQQNLTTAHLFDDRDVLKAIQLGPFRVLILQHPTEQGEGFQSRSCCSSPTAAAPT